MKINQITVPSLDVERSVEFYTILGLRPIVLSLPKYARLMNAEDEATFSIHHVNELPKGEGVMVYFECDDLDERVDQLIKKGIDFDHEPMDQSWLWREARLKDPDGNQLILFFAGENRLNPPWRIN